MCDLLPAVRCVKDKWSGLLLKNLVWQGGSGFQQPVEQFCYITGHSLMACNEALGVVKGYFAGPVGSPQEAVKKNLRKG